MVRRGLLVTKKKGVVQTLIFQNEGGGIGNRILNPCLTFLWCSMFLLWLFCVINSGCINPGAPRNVYQYTEQIQSRFRIFNLNNTYSFWNLQKEGWYLGLPNQMKVHSVGRWGVHLDTSWAFLWNILINKLDLCGKFRDIGFQVHSTLEPWKSDTLQPLQHVFLFVIGAPIDIMGFAYTFMDKWN